MEKRNIPLFLTVLVVAALSLVLLASSLTSTTLAVTAEDETADRIAKNRQYLQDAQVAFTKKLEEDKVAKYEEQKKSTESEEEKLRLQNLIDASAAEIERLEEEIRELEKLNMQLYVMEPELEARLYSVEQKIFDKYLNQSSPSYLGENPVESIFSDVLTRSVVIFVNPDKVLADGSNMPVEETVDGIPVIVEQTKIEEVSCTNNSRTKVCRPVIGGVSASEKNTLSLDTIGYKATRNGSTGVVMAGHSVKGENKIIVQPHNDATKRIGVVPVGGYCKQTTSPRCDFAFVKLDSGITAENKIFKGSGQYYNIVSKTPDSSQILGTFIIKSGAGTGNTIGEVFGNANTSGNNVMKHALLDPSCATGDSGAPVFWESGGDAKIFGEMYNCYFYPRANAQLSDYYP